MKSAKDRKEKLFWELQLLSVNTHVKKCPHQSSCTQGKTQMEEGEHICSVRGLRKAARHSWAKLVTEGVQSILACPRKRNNTGVRGHAWGCVSVSDILLLMEAKYDVVSRLLYADMLQEHHTVNEWEALPPWRRHKEEVWLEDLAEEALESNDMLRLAELPGAFKIYRVCPESSRECFTAVSLLYKLNTSRHQERESLTALAEKLDKESLRLVCLHIRFATLRAQREKTCNDAYLGVQQSWNMWPHVHNPCRQEQAASLLHSEEVQEHVRDSQSSQQALLQLLVLAQEEERKHLISMLHGVTLEDVQRPGSTKPPKADCVERLKQIRSSWKTCSDNDKPQSDVISSPPTEWSQDQLERVCLILLTHVIELQEREASSLLQELMDKSEQHLQELREAFESKLQAHHHANLLQLMKTEPPSTTSDSHSSQEKVQDQSGCSGPNENQNLTAGPPQSLTTTNAISSEVNGVQTEEVPNKQGVCAGCGVTLGSLPYLEVLCVPDKNGEEGGHGDEEQDSKTKNQNYDEQDSLITLAWSTRPEDHTSREGDAVKLQTDPFEGHSTAEHCRAAAGESHTEKLRPSLTQMTHTTLGELDSLDMKQHDLCSAVSSETVDKALVKGHCHKAERDTEIDSSSLMKHERASGPVSAVEREKTMRKLVDVHRRAERKQQRDRERQQLRVQERLSIIQSRKAEDDLFGHKHRDRMRHLTKELSQEDKNKQKTMVREKLEQLRRERSFIMQSRRKKNTAGLKDLLDPVLPQSRTEDRVDTDSTIWFDY
ncbi:uncharacterized protein LOC129181232 [Dunckerocampus dactyliophorus]|uniref:uncharacterized protein LOC129181232 n=1 Tax=Dunckerocampus dactyliophorus TaxID=161453 RepID=UPI002405C404|nr:uncharacterized protein LOC129181232 [Dunckerocampus dactyliophorus]